jgi:hypothetical protein
MVFLLPAILAEPCISHWHLGVFIMNTLQTLNVLVDSADDSLEDNYIQTGYCYLEEYDLYLAVSVNVRELSPEIIRAYNYCVEYDANSIKLNTQNLIMDSECINISIGSDPVEVVTAESGELEVEIEVDKYGRTTLLFGNEQYADVGYIVLFNGFGKFDTKFGCQPVKFGQQFDTNLVKFTDERIVNRSGDTVIAGSDHVEVLIEIVFATKGQLQPDQMRELQETAMNELGSGLSVAEAVAEAMIHGVQKS